jgi:hypothetical protein
MGSLNGKGGRRAREGRGVAREGKGICLAAARAAVCRGGCSNWTLGEGGGGVLWVQQDVWNKELRVVRQSLTLLLLLLLQGVSGAPCDRQG